MCIFAAPTRCSNSLLYGRTHRTLRDIALTAISRPRCNQYNARTHHCGRRLTVHTPFTIIYAHIHNTARPPIALRIRSCVYCTCGKLRALVCVLQPRLLWLWFAIYTRRCRPRCSEGNFSVGFHRIIQSLYGESLRKSRVDKRLNSDTKTSAVLRQRPDQVTYFPNKLVFAWNDLRRLQPALKRRNHLHGQREPLAPADVEWQ